MSSIHLLRLKDANGEYLLTAQQVAKHHSVSNQAVYASRTANNKLDKVMIVDLICKEKSIIVRKNKSWKLRAVQVAKFNDVNDKAVYQARYRGTETLDKLLFFCLMKHHFLDDGVCGADWLMEAYIDSGISKNNFCIKGTK